MLKFMAATILSFLCCSDGGGVVGHISVGNDSAEEIDPITWDECGHAIGEHPCDFTFVNQHGEEVALYDYVGQPLVIDMSTMWCSFCGVAALELTKIKGEYQNVDLDVVTLLFENGNREQPAVDELAYWAHTFRTEDNILSASTDILSGDTDKGWPLEGWPTFYIVDEHMIIRGYMVGFHPEMLRETIEESLCLFGAPHSE